MITDQAQNLMNKFSICVNHLFLWEKTIGIQRTIAAGSMFLRPAIHYQVDLTGTPDQVGLSGLPDSVCAYQVSG
jgi:hypothetical protein